MIEQHGITLFSQLVAKKTGIYTVYIFKNLDTDRYLACTKCPNWNTSEIDIGQQGFLTYKFVEAGKDSWINKETGEYISYQYSANYFLEFIPSSHVIANNVVTKLHVG